MNWTELIGQTLIHFVWQGGLLMGVAMAALVLLRKSSAQARYWTCCAVLLMMALTPVLTAVVLAPDMRLQTPISGLTLDPAINGSPSFKPLPPTPASIPMPDESALRWIVIGWLVGVAGLTIRVLGGVITLAGLSQKRTPVPTELQQRFESLAKRIGLRWLPKLYLSDRVDVPTVIGAFRGVVLLPASVATGMPPRLLETILVHELAHVARFDFLVNAFQAVIEVVLFYHPAVWWVSQRIREERENCCDDLVIATLSDRKTYAHALTALAELRGHSLAMRADGGELLARVRRILGETSMKSILSPLPVAILLGAVVLVPTIQGFAARPEPPPIGMPTQSPPDKKSAPASKSKIRSADKVAAPSQKDPMAARSKLRSSDLVPRQKDPLQMPSGKAAPADLPRTGMQDPLGLPSKRTSDVPAGGSDLVPRQKNPLQIPSGQAAPADLARTRTQKPLGPQTGPRLDIPPAGQEVPFSSDQIPPMSDPVGQRKADQAAPRIPRQAGEYHIEQLNLDIEALLAQRRAYTDMANAAERKLVELEIDLEAARIIVSNDQRARQINEELLTGIRADIMKVTAQLKVLEKNLGTNDSRLAEKRRELEAIWKKG